MIENIGKNIIESDKFSNDLTPKFENDNKLDRPISKEDLMPDFYKEEVRKNIDENSPYSKEINDNIKSEQELDVYKKANLKENEINDKKCLEKTDIDYEQIDEDGKTNLERMEDGKPPLDKNGNPIELHHIGQKSDSPLAELTKEEHRGRDNHSVLHDVSKESEIDREKFSKERSDYWKARAEEIKK